ncbi:MAG TPA: tRNA (uridine(54)-C5)-methyltransferase TrmA [Marinagarivorans sp.]
MTEITNYSPVAYAQQLAAKEQQTIEQFATFKPPALQVFSSPPQHYRMRAEFKIWHSEGRCDYAMFKPGTPKQTYIIQDFPAASETINRLMPQLLAKLNANELLRRKLFQCEFLSTTTGDCLVTLIYHKPLCDQWQTAAEQLSQQLGCQIIGRARKQKRVLTRDWAEERLNIAGREFVYEHVEASFTQPNASICTDMLNWAFDHTRNSEGDLLELYCGNGNFTLPLAQNFSRVVATEIAKSSVDSAKRNMARNNIDNIAFARLSSEEFTQAIEGVRAFKRLEHLDLNSYRFSTVLVDPPRAGLDDGTIKLIQRFERIIYVSCNPDTLYNNLQQLCQSHDIAHWALFDQFPFTHHRECGVILQTKPA